MDKLVEISTKKGFFKTEELEPITICSYIKYFLKEDEITARNEDLEAMNHFLKLIINGKMKQLNNK